MRELARRSSCRCPRPDRDDARGPGEGTERYRLHYAIRNLLERLTTRQPMLLALDDVHWADAASIEVMTHLLRRFRGPLLMAVAYRHAPARLLAALEGSAGRRRQPARARAAERKRGAAIDRARRGSRGRATLYRESGGNPFYIEQLARSSHARRIREMLGLRTVARSRFPRAVIAAIEEELITVADPARVALQAAAVAGDPFEPELVAAIAERDVPAVLAELDELLRLDFIRPDGRAETLPLPPSDRPQRGVRRDAAWLADRRAHARASAALAAAHAPPPRERTTSRTSRPRATSRRSALLLRAGRDAAQRAPESGAADGCSRRPGSCRPRTAGERRLSLLGRSGERADVRGCLRPCARGARRGQLARRRPSAVAERAELVTKIVFAKRMSGRPLESRALVTEMLEAVPPDSLGSPRA